MKKLEIEYFKQFDKNCLYLPDKYKDSGEEIVDKINDLPLDDEFKIDAKHIKNLPKGNTTIGGGLSRYAADSLYAPIGSTGGSGISESLAIAYAVAL